MSPCFPPNASTQRGGYRICVTGLIQPQRLDCRLVDRSGNKQTLVALIIRQGGTRLHAERTGNRTAVVTRLLQCHLNIHDHLVGQQITVSVDRAIVIIITVERIVAQGGIPIARVQIIISAVNENDGCETLLPPIAMMPFVPMTAESIGIASAISFAVLIPPRRVPPGFTVR